MKINEETVASDIAGVDVNLDKVNKRPSFKEFLTINTKKKKRKETSVLQKQKNKQDS